jgi:hypothetical protein
MASLADRIAGHAPGLLGRGSIGSQGLSELELCRIVTEHAVLEPHGLVHPEEFRVLGMTLIAFEFFLRTQGRIGPSKQYHDNNYKKPALHENIITLKQPCQYDIPHTGNSVLILVR